MEHSFNVEDARKYGVECAVLLKNIRFWLDKNLSNKKHFKEDRVWTYNSARAFSELFPYMNTKQIYRRLEKLESDGVLIKGNFNEVGYDKTTWYSVESPKYVISQKWDMDFPETGNRTPKNGEPIPDENPNGNPDNKLSLIDAEIYPSFEDFWEIYDKKVGKKDKVKKKWDKISQSDKEKIMEYIPLYIYSQPNKKYRKNPEVFINNESWNDEIIISEENKPKINKRVAVLEKNSDWNV